MRDHEERDPGPAGTPGKETGGDANATRGSLRPLRVLFVVHGFPPQDLAGTEVYTLTVATGLKARGHHVAVFHRLADSGAPDYRLDSGTHAGLPVYRLVNNFHYRGIQETYENPHVEQRFQEVVAREKPDVVHFQHALHTSVSLITRAADQGLPTVVTLNDYWFICPTVQLILPDRSLCHPRRAGIGCVRCARNPGLALRAGQAVVRALGPAARLGSALYGRLVERFPRLRRDVLDDARALGDRPGVIRNHLRRADRVLAPSRFLRQQYITFGLAPDRIEYQRYGIDTTRFRDVRKTPREGPLRVGFIGSFVWYKGLHVLIEAFRDIRHDQAMLTVFGNPDAPPEVRDYARACRERALGAPVRFAGPLDQRDLAEAHRSLDVLVVPSLWYENSPLVILEAQAARTPVVVSDLGGMAEMVEPGRTGFRFPRGNPTRLRALLLELAAEPLRVDRVREAIRDPKDMPAHLDELERVYREEIHKVSPGPASEV